MKAQDQMPQNARARLAALREKKPPKKAAQIRALWPEIKAALDEGHSLKSVCHCLEADGIAVSVQTLGSYITRLRRKSDPAFRLTPAIDNKAQTKDAGRVVHLAESGREKPFDPLANIRREREKKRNSGFDYRPDLADPKELI